MTKLIKEIWTVQGTGNFPIDMLRYDSCFPASETESHKITASFQEHGPHKIRLARYRQSDMRAEPHYERWKSFCWEVVRDSYVKGQF